MSKEHYDYIRKLKKNNIIILIIQIGIFIGFLITWELFARIGIINSFISSCPSKIIKTIIMLIKSNSLFNNIIITLFETILSLILCFLIGFTTSSILWYKSVLYRVFEPYLTILNSLPKVALGPIIIIWFGANMKSIIFMSLLISVIITIINLYQAFNETDKLKIKLMKSLGASKLQIYFKLILPANISNIISTIKISISMCLIGVIMGEFLVSKEGLGYLIMYGSQVFNLDLVMSGILIICIFAIILYYLVLYIEKRLRN